MCMCVCVGVCECVNECLPQRQRLKDTWHTTTSTQIKLFKKSRNKKVIIIHYNNNLILS